MAYAALRALTDLTGAEAQKDRTTVIASFEVSYPALWAALWGLIPGLTLAMIFGGLINPTAGLAAFLVGEALGIWLILGRSSTGLKRKHYQSLRDRNAYSPGTFVLCGYPIDPALALRVKVMSSSVPLMARDAQGGLDIDESFGLTRRRTEVREVDPTAFIPLITARQARRGALHASAARTVSRSAGTGVTDDIADMLTRGATTS
ncbi:hypothetical protein ACFWGN_14925 [Oerskovia sp. NPDC060338]|uniref:hypothetical protein n=1 Tax=Oerskovia sp. NPDC060338 TaxID=3347100 RepID=UPI0036618CBF